MNGGSPLTTYAKKLVPRGLRRGGGGGASDGSDKAKTSVGTTTAGTAGDPPRTSTSSPEPSGTEGYRFADEKRSGIEPPPGSKEATAGTSPAAEGAVPGYARRKGRRDRRTLRPRWTRFERSADASARTAEKQPRSSSSKPHSATAGGGDNTGVQATERSAKKENTSGTGFQPSPTEIVDPSDETIPTEAVKEVFDPLAAFCPVTEKAPKSTSAGKEGVPDQAAAVLVAANRSRPFLDWTTEDGGGEEGGSSRDAAVQPFRSVRGDRPQSAPPPPQQQPPAAFLRPHMDEFLAAGFKVSTLEAILPWSSFAFCSFQQWLTQYS